MSVATDETSLKQWISTRHGEPTYVGEHRIKAIQAFEALPWPSKKEEEWRRTRITKLDLDSFQILGPGEEGNLKKSGYCQDYGGWINGHFCDPSLDEESRRLGVKILSMDQAFDQYPDQVQKFFQEDEKLWDNRFTPWLATVQQTGTFVFIPKNCVLTQPIEIFIQDDRQGALSTHNLYVVASQLSQATVLVRTKNQSPGILFNQGISLLVEDGARLDALFIQDIHRESNFVQDGQALIHRDGRLNHWSGDFGANIEKSRFIGRIVGPGAEFVSKGIFFATESQHKDIRVVQVHEAPHAHSDALYKGAVRDKGRTVFQGMIEVRENASGTDAYLTNKNLILNDGARADSLPMLKIDTNDVKCSHGSTTGKVDEEEVFYLQARGMSMEDAKLLISQGLFQEVIEGAPEYLWEELEHRVIVAVGS